MKRMRIALLSLALFGEVAASRVFFRPLAEVMTPQTGVVWARLAHCRTHQGASEYQVFCKLEEVKVLRGAPPAPELLHSFSTIVERDGMRVSPIRDGSGLEMSLQTGTRYYFLLDSSGKFLVRVEAEAAGPEIRRLLSQ